MLKTRTYTLRLNPFGKRPRKLARKQRVFRIAFKVTPANGRALQINGGPEHHLNIFVFGVLSDRRANTLN